MTEDVQRQPVPSPHRNRLEKDIEKLSEYVDPDFDGWTRSSFTGLYREAREWLGGRMEDAGLVTRMDAAANLIGRLEGTEPGLPPLMIGSHTDTVRNGGRFDGIIGVLAGVEIVRLIREHRLRLRHPLELVDFTAEEPTVFGISTVGSKAMAGNLTDEMLRRVDLRGRSLAAALTEAGGSPGNIFSARRQPGEIAAYLELHIEQGPLLEREGMNTGLVIGIVGIDRFILQVEGSPDHAGTTPMGRRRDALAGASELVLQLEETASQFAGKDLVATVGRMEITPNASNVVAGRVVLDAEIRSADAAQAGRAAENFLKEAEVICRRRGLGLSAEQISHTDPVLVPEAIFSAVREACERSGGRWREIVSGAGHDANQVATFAPAGMIFLPSTGGRSHCPEEYTPMEEILRGTMVLLDSILILDRRLDSETEQDS